MAGLKLGVAARGDTPADTVRQIEQLDQLGVFAAWLTTGGAGPDGLSIMSAAAGSTEKIMLGTSIIPTWPRHPIVSVQQAQVIESLAPGRFRLGLGPSHRPSIEPMYGFEFQAPLAHLREYVHIARTLLHTGAVDFSGEHYRAHANLPIIFPDLPVMASALRTRSFEYCGAETDGAISWMCPLPYLRDVAVPALQAGAKSAGRPVPPLVAHVPVTVHEDVEEVRAAAREQFATYPRLPFYAQMFADAGYPEAKETSGWSDRMIDEVIVHGDEKSVSERLNAAFECGATELLISVLEPGDDRSKSWQRTARLIADLCN